VVQKRFISRENRIEIAPEWGIALGGDTYVRTQTLGINAYYHIIPQFSVSAKYQQSFNRLTPEGQAMVEAAYNQYLENPAEPKGLMPELNYSLNQQLVAVQWYPLYGKMSWLGKAVTQFDLYLNAGLGNMQLIRGSTRTTQLGGGIGVWLTPKMSLRGELFWQGYQAQYLTGNRDMNLTQLSVQMGWLL
jgi:outer membrane beta-barrel protein